MKHRMKGRRLGRSPSHLTALKRNMASQLFAHGQIITTVAKAKELRPFAERLITIAKKASAELDAAKLASDDAEKARAATANALHHRRRLMQLLGGRKMIDVKEVPVDVVGEKLIDELGPRYQDRPGGYTRIIKQTKVRLGDAAPTAILALVTEPMKAKTAAAVAPTVS